MARDVKRWALMLTICFVTADAKASDDALERVATEFLMRAKVAMEAQSGTARSVAQLRMLDSIAELDKLQMEGECLNARRMLLRKGMMAANDAQTRMNYRMTAANAAAAKKSLEEAQSWMQLFVAFGRCDASNGP